MWIANSLILDRREHEFVICGAVCAVKTFARTSEMRTFSRARAMGVCAV